MNCLAIDRNKKSCRVSTIGHTRFCKFHQYMTEYTDEMLSKLELCSGCKKAYCFETDTRTCETCKTRSKTNRKKEREQVILCSKQGCKFKKSDDNKYCKIHQIELFVDEVTEENKKLCVNYIRGCRSKLEQSYMFSRCQDCLAIDREKDRARRGAVREQNVGGGVVVGYTTEKGCTTCYKVLPIEEFRGIRTEITATCKACRDDNKIQDTRRDIEHRNELARVNDAKPERVEVKKQWREDNYEKVAKYGMNSRQHKIERIGVDEYLKENAEQAKNWRENNPEKQIEFNIKRHNSYETQYDNYRRSAELKQLEFVITFDEYAILVKNSCHYCGEIQERGFNGVDRENSAKGYMLENCVSCCKMCNYMKNTLHKDVFMKRVEHILTFNGVVEGNLYPELFGDHLTAYHKYRDRALRKQLDFALIPSDYEKITNNPCYMCGKENSNNHKNGIDRFDNDIGYLLDNCRPCCGECNYMKREYSYVNVFNKFRLIYEKNKNEVDKETENIVISIEEIEESNQPETNKSIVKGNKKTPEQIKENAKVRKQKQREQLKERYGDEEYKKIRAKEIADQRKKRDENMIVKRTPEQIKETNRIRKQKQREKQHKQLETQTLVQYEEPLHNTIREETVTQPTIDDAKANKIREQNRIRKQRQREQSVEQNILQNAIEKREEIVEKNIEENTEMKINQPIPDAIREQNRIRKQKQREKEKEKYGDEEYKKLNAEKIADYRKKKTEKDNNL